MRISPADLARLHALEAAMGGASLLEYVPRVTPQWVIPWHLRPVADLFARAEYEPVRACVSVPPRHGKTELLLHAIPWWLHRHPGHTVGYISYSADLAHQKARRALELAQRSKVPLKAGTQKVHAWKTTRDGGLLATGIGGPLTGHGTNLLIVDDPTKNREEAESPTVRQKTWEWFTSTGLTRVEPGGSVIVVHTRWHDDDLIGRLKRERLRRWEVVNLPAISSGEALWPGRWPLDALKLRKAEVGEYDWHSLYMGEPRPKGGRLFKDPTFYEWPRLENIRLLIVCDPAATEKTYSDYSAIVVGAGWRDASGLPHVDILDVVRVQVEIPTLAGYLVEVQKKWNAPVAVEAVGGFKAVPQMLRQVNPSLRIIELQPTGDKFTRSLPTAAAWNDGRIRIPLEATWLAEFLHEVLMFTGVRDVHDDQVDALAHLYATFAKLIPKKPGRVDRAADWLPYG